MFSPRSEVIYEKCSSENLSQEVSIKEVEKEGKSAPEFKNEENFIPISSRFFENQPYEIQQSFEGKASKGTFLKPQKLQNPSNEGKGKEKKNLKKRARRRKGREEKKAMVALLVFIISTLERVFGRKKPFDTKGLFGENVIKNPARYTQSYPANRVSFDLPR